MRASDDSCNNAPCRRRMGRVPAPQAWHQHPWFARQRRRVQPTFGQTAVQSLNHRAACRIGRRLSGCEAAAYGPLVTRFQGTQRRTWPSKTGRSRRSGAPEVLRRADSETARLERFYSVSENRTISTTALLEGLKTELRARAGALPLPLSGAVTLVSRRIPWGFAFPELPSTHLFSYSDLGISIINGVTAGRTGNDGSLTPKAG